MSGPENLHTPTRTADGLVDVCAERWDGYGWRIEWHTCVLPHEHTSPHRCSCGSQWPTSENHKPHTYQDKPDTTGGKP
jgi:hypothetical protein